MNFKKPKFWDDSRLSFWSLILYPFSLLFLFASLIIKLLKTQKKFSIPIICVGNIYVGGTGKTPLAIEIFKIIKSNEKNPGFIKKGYDYLYDEIQMLKKNGETFTNKNRKKAISSLILSGHNVAILDDGFQDHSIKKDINILCFNKKQLIGNGMVIPSGPLREGLNSIKRAHIIIINGSKDSFFEKQIFNISEDIQIYYAKYLPINIEFLRGKNLCAFAGIGNPNNFFELLSEYNLNVQKKIAFPDHYAFNEKEIKEMTEEANKNNFELITTEKDFYRIKDIGFNKLKYLKIDIEVKGKNNLMSEILSHL